MKMNLTETKNTRFTSLTAPSFLALALLAGCSAGTDQEPRPEELACATSSVSHAQLQRISLPAHAPKRAADAAPLVKDLPALDEIDNVDARKARFVSIVLPIVDAVNRDTLRARKLVAIALDCRDKSRPLASSVEAKILRMAREHAGGDDLQSLYRNLDAVPPSLALAQSAIESGWGTSRFAQKGNALFGQYVAPGEGGMMPKGVDKDSTIRLAKFEALVDSVRSYVRNLNSHNAYAGFRAKRR